MLIAIVLIHLQRIFGQDFSCVIMWTHDNLLLLGLLVLVCGILFGVMVLVYGVCFGFRGRAQTNGAGINSLFAGNVLYFHEPPQIAQARGRLQGLNNETLGEVREISEVHPPMGEEEINDLSVHEHKVTIPKSEISSAQEASSSTASAEGPMKVDLNMEALEEEAICSMCLVPLPSDEPRLNFPCSHQVHLECIYEGLGKRVACPTCKFPADIGSIMDPNRRNGMV
ncbi:hypothetical protein ACH5RR_010102 [Cinchona calisaya]|uniref:RING-type E3 ubiquitin transferase n=1 Tax=Cinchona calisaya TaxID=153742 RepID=A0ABD3AG10_9GENT